MIQIDDLAIKAMEEAMDNRIRAASVGKRSSHVAEVVDIDEEGTVWVHIFGGASRTPVRTTLASVTKGDIVTATVSNGSVTIDGSQSSPSASVDYVDRVNEAIANYAKFAISSVLGDVVKLKKAMIDEATVQELLAMNATVQTLQAWSINANELIASKADLNYVSANYAEANFANVSSAEVGMAKIVELLANSGVFNNLVLQDGVVTGQLASVEVLGDLIRANTIVADKIVFQGVDSETGEQTGLWYYLNKTGAGNLSADELSLAKYRDALDGSNIVAKSITANQVNTQSLAADSAFLNDLTTRMLLAQTVQVGMSSASHIVMQGDRMSFLDKDGAEVAYIAVDSSGESMFYITRAMVVKDLRFGNWKWYDRRNGNMALRWMGTSQSGGGES